MTAAGAITIAGETACGLALATGAALLGLGYPPTNGLARIYFAAAWLIICTASWPLVRAAGWCRRMATAPAVRPKTGRVP